MYHLLQGQQPRKLLCSYGSVDTSKGSFKGSCYLRLCQLPVISFPCNLVSRRRLGVSASGKAVSGIAKLRSLSSSNRLPPVCGHLDALVELCLPCWETWTSLLELCWKLLPFCVYSTTAWCRGDSCGVPSMSGSLSVACCYVSCFFPFVFSPKRVQVSCVPQLSGSSWRDKIVAATFPSLAFAFVSWNLRFWKENTKMWQTNSFCASWGLSQPFATQTDGLGTGWSVTIRNSLSGVQYQPSNLKRFVVVMLM